MRRGTWFGILWRVAVCLPFVFFMTALLVSRWKPQSVAHLSADLAYAHFLVDGRFIVLRGDYAGWMIERRWREDLKTTLNLALRNQQETVNFWTGTRELRDRVRRSTPPPELTEALARESTLFFLGKAKKTTHGGVLTRATCWPPRTGTPVKIDAVHIRRLVEASTVPVFFVVALYCIGVRRQDRRKRRNACLSCGYSLVGNASGVCPECGTPIGEREPARGPAATGRIARLVRRLRLGLFVRAILCLPLVFLTAVLILASVKPGAATYLSVDQTYAHFLIDSRFVAVRGPFADWMVEEQWRTDATEAHRVARRNQQEGISRRGLAFLWGRVERSVPKPVLTESIVRQLSARVLALSTKETRVGIWTRGVFKTPSAEGLVKIEAIALVPLVGLCAIPPVALIAVACVRSLQRRRARRLGVCSSCDHELADDDRGICPVCGTTAETAERTNTGNEP